MSAICIKQLIGITCIKLIGFQFYQLKNESS